MAQKNIQMNKRNEAGTGWDSLYPITKIENVEGFEQVSYKKLYSQEDSEGMFTKVEFRRENDTLAATSVLSGGTTPLYTTRTLTYYGKDGITVEATKVRTLTYNTDGKLISEV